MWWRVEVGQFVERGVETGQFGMHRLRVSIRRKRRVELLFLRRADLAVDIGVDELDKFRINGHQCKPC